MILLHFILFDLILSKAIECEIDNILGHLEIQHIQNAGIGLITTKNIQKGQSILNIPLSCSLDYKKPYPLSDLLYSTTFPPEIYLLIRFLYEKYYSSSRFFKEYLTFLPQTLRNFPYFDTEEISLLSVDTDPLYFSDYQIFKNLLHNTPYETLTTWENWKYSLGIIASRAFLFKTDTDIYPVLIPVMDFLNYDPSFIDHLTSGYKITSQFSLQAERNFSSGEEVVWSYGAKSTNRELLWSYGFIIKNNPYQCVSLVLLNSHTQVCSHDYKHFFNKWQEMHKTPSHHLVLRGEILSKLFQANITKTLSQSMTAEIQAVAQEELELLALFLQELS